MSEGLASKGIRGRVGPHSRQRVAALVAVVAEAIGTVTIIVLVVLQPLFAIVLIGVFGVMLVCGLAAVALPRPIRWAAAAASIIAAGSVVALVLFWGDRTGVPLLVPPVALILLGAGVLLGRYAIKHPPPTTDLDAMQTDGVAGRRSVLIINPRSGDGKAGEFDLAETARGLGVEAVVMGPDDDLETLARDAVTRGAEVLGMAGGDGSQALVLSIAIEHDLPFVCIPSGTRNHFALDLGLDRTDPRHALAAFVDGEERSVDVGVVNGRTFVNNVALGAYAAIVDQDGYRDAKVSTALEMLPSLLEREGPWFDLRFDVPEHGHLDQAVLLLVSNNPYSIGSNTAQRETLTGGQLGVITVNPERISDLVAITVLAAAGRAESSQALWTWSTAEFTVRSDETEIVAGIDGERVALQPPLEFRTHADAARVLVPLGTRVGLAEQSSAPPTYAGLLALAFNLNPPDQDDTPGTDEPPVEEAGDA